MLKRKLMYVLLGVLLASPSGYLTASDNQSEFEKFKKQHLGEFETYKETLEREFGEFKKIALEETQKYQSRVGEKWDEPELSSKKVWVEYSKDLNVKKRVDFESQTIEIATTTEDGKVSDEQTRENLKRLLTKNQAEAFNDDPVAQAIEKKSKEKITLLETAKVKPTPILLPMVTEEKKPSSKKVDQIVDDLMKKKQKVVVKNKKGQNVVKIKIPLATATESQSTEVEKPRATKPPEGKEPVKDSPTATTEKPLDTVKSAGKPSSVVEKKVETKVEKSAAQKPKPKAMAELRVNKLPKRAREVLEDVQRNAKKQEIDVSLMFAIIETESAFNPMAKSPIPAYGLMQIVPSSAGMDATQKLFGKGRILSPSYLYTQDKNIEVGAAYLNILYFRYLRRVEDPLSRLYCVIAAYNTGAGNVSRAFIGSTKIGRAFPKINSMTPEQVYNHLIENLPYEETQNYLKKVRNRMPKYEV